MIRLCLLLAAWARTALALGLRDIRLESAVFNAADLKADKTEMDALSEQAAKLQKELSEISANPNATSVLTSSDRNGLKDALEVAFKLPADLQHDDWLPAPDQKEMSMSQQAPSRVYSYPYVSAAKQVPKAKLRKKGSVNFASQKLANQHSQTAAARIVPPIVRPNAGKRPETIFFGLYAKSFYGVGLKDNNFMIDIVMTLKWIDKRVSAIIPKGLDEMTLSKRDAEHQIWLPGMAVTNRDIHKYDLVSTAVMINRKGEVFKVDRSTVRVKNQYVLNDYPYDEQKLVVKIASSKYMMDEVMLKPMPNKEGIGVAKDLLKGYSYTFVDVGATVVKDVNGALKKSRGLLTITVKRDSDQYFQSHLIPCFLVTCISCGIFWFPFVAPFITPRVALSILALVAFTNLSIKSSEVLPSGAPYNWNDCFNQTILTLMFANVCMNIFSEICFHQLKVNDVATSINSECKALMPLLCALSVGTILSTAGPGGWMTLGTASVVVKIIIAAIVGGYVAFSVSRVTAALTKKRTLEADEAVKPN